MFRPEGKQARLATIFHDKGKRISLDEKLSWDPDVDVFLQENAWMITKVCVNGLKKTLKNLLLMKSLRDMFFCWTI